MDIILDDDKMKFTQVFAELSKRERPSGHWYRIRATFGKRQFKTYSDVGGLKIGNEAFSVIVPNGVGDGTTRVAVFDTDDLPPHYLMYMMNYFTTVVGDFDIYDYDCGNEIAMHISGKYHIYEYEGLIAFEKVGE